MVFLFLRQSHCKCQNTKCKEDAGWLFASIFVQYNVK